MPQNAAELDFDPDDDSLLPLHPRLGLHHPFPPFQAASFSPCCLVVHPLLPPPAPRLAAANLLRSHTAGQGEHLQC